MLVVGPAAFTVHVSPCFQHHGAAVIEHRAVQIHRRRILHQVRMHRVAAGVDVAADQHDVADFQRPHLLFGERRAQHHFAAAEREAFALRHFFHRDAPGRDRAIW